MFIGLVFSSCSNTISEKNEKGECIYKTNEGHKEGLCVCYYKNGRVSDSVYYINDLMTGVKLSYDSLGRMKSYITYREGKKNGVYANYYTNGNVYTRCFYKNDSLIGWHYNYYLNKILKSMEEYVLVNGQIEINQGKYFNEDGSNDSLTRSSFISVKIDRDTIELLDTFLLKVELEKSYFIDRTNHITKLFIGSYDSNYVLKDTLNSILYISRYYKFRHPIIANKLGENTIRGVVNDDSTYQKDVLSSFDRQSIYFTKKYYVVK